MSVNLFQVDYPIEKDNENSSITVGEEKIYLNHDTQGRYVMMNGNKYYVGGRTRRNRRKRRTRKYKK